MNPSSQRDRIAFSDYAYSKIKIESNGDVHNCAWMKSGALGNLLRSNLEEIWNGRPIKRVRKAIENVKLTPVCNCGRCPFKFQNWVTSIKHLVDFPNIVELDLPNTHCNIGGTDPTTGQPACIMCPRSARNFRSDVDCCDEIAQHLSHYLGHFKKIHLQGIAEPFWKDRAFEILDLLKSRQRPDIEISTITNCTVFSERVRNRWRDFCPNSLTMFSVDAASPETYEKIRRIDGFDRVVTNLREFCREKDAGPICGIVNNINIYNVDEVPSIVEMVADVGCDYISLNATDDVDQSTSHFVVNETNFTRFAKAELKAKERATELGVSLIFAKPLDKNIGTNKS